ESRHRALERRLARGRALREAASHGGRGRRRVREESSGVGDVPRRNRRCGRQGGGMRGAWTVTVLLAVAPCVLAQQRNFDSEINAALGSAKAAAAFDFTGTLARICLLPQSGGEDTSDSLPVYIADPSKVPARDTWYAEPAKVFDNFYFVGGKIHSSWALATLDGIILFDTIYPYNSEELIVGGMKKLGLDPKNIKYVLISHAHGDHIGGAEMLQKRYGVRVVMGGPDWDTVVKHPNRYKTM